jgi:hypothetical protein
MPADAFCWPRTFTVSNHSARSAGASTYEREATSTDVRPDGRGTSAERPPGSTSSRSSSQGTCADCGLADPAVLEFDHVGKKRMEVGKMVREAYRLERIEAEIANTELVCANCHRRRTAIRIRSWRVDAEWRSPGYSRPLRRRNLLFLLDYLRGAPCVDCGENDPVVLDFDHVGTKRAGVVQLAGREHSIASLEREIAECEVRCANCHRRRTILEQGHFRNHLVTPP